MYKIKIIDNQVVKKIFPRKTLDLSAKETFDLEIEALQRLQISARFPKIVSIEESDFLIKMSYCGYPLNRIQKRYAEEGYFVSKFNYKKINRQIDYISFFLKNKNISYLDLRLSNICITKKHNIYLVDFGMVALDDNPIGNVLKQRYDEFCANGGQARFSEQMKEIVFDLIKCADD